MCCVCDSSNLTIYNTYWYPHQWEKAVKAAISHGVKTGKKQRVVLQSFSTGGNGWLLDSSRR